MNELTLAVAGGRKTQSIVDACGATQSTSVAVLGYTLASQAELESRIRAVVPFGSTHIEVVGWYAFLLRNFVRPYLPMLYPGHRLRGFNYEGEPQLGYRASGVSRFLDSDDRAYGLHLSKLAIDVADASGGSVIDRLEHIYTDVFIDEVQDLCGYDLDIVQRLLESKLNVHLVGDMRQAVLATNIRDKRHKKFRFEKVINWFRLQERHGRLVITERPETYRSNQAIADFSDSVFDASLGYPKTISNADYVDTGHDGIFAVRPEHIPAYREQFEPRCLRYSANSGRGIDLPFMNFTIAKGRTERRVLIYPTEPIKKFLRAGLQLEGKSACGLYVAVTRAQYSVAFILTDPESYNLPIWQPGTGL